MNNLFCDVKSSYWSYLHDAKDDADDDEDVNGDNIVDGSSLKGVRTLSGAVGSDVTSNRKSFTQLLVISLVISFSQYW